MAIHRKTTGGVRMAKPSLFPDDVIDSYDTPAFFLLWTIHDMFLCYTVCCLYLSTQFQVEWLCHQDSR